MGGGGGNSRDGSYSIMYGGVEVASGGDFDSSTTHTIGKGCSSLSPSVSFQPSSSLMPSSSPT
eukprot:939290-Ditylum_brightwellii.AAC.1